MGYKEGNREVTSQVRAVPLGQKRKRGRPKGLGNCLLRSPTQSRVSPPTSRTSTQAQIMDSPARSPSTLPQSRVSPHADGAQVSSMKDSSMSSVDVSESD